MEKALVDYVIISGGEYCDTLETEVKDAICFGWEPQGGPFVVDGKIFQAMIKREKLS